MIDRIILFVILAHVLFLIGHLLFGVIGYFADDLNKWAVRTRRIPYEEVDWGRWRRIKEKVTPKLFFRAYMSFVSLLIFVYLVQFFRS